MKQGFTLIEVLIAVLIASIVSGILFTVWFQINRGVNTVQTFIDLYAKEAMIQQNLERDFTGAFYPMPFEQPKQEKKAEQKKSETVETIEESKQINEEINKAFYATMKEEQLELVTCITNNPAQVYWSDTAGEGKPRIVRVVYRLEPQESKTGQPTYKLMRQESTNLNFDVFQEGEKSPRSFEVLNDIKSLKVQYTGLVVTLEGKEGKAEPKITLETVNTWDSDKRVEKKNKEEQNVYRAEIPSIITFNFTLLNENKKRERSFSIMVPIPIDTTPYQLQQLHKEKEEQARQQKTKVQQGSSSAEQPAAGSVKTSVETDQVTVVVTDTQGKPVRGPGMNNFFKHAGQFMQQLQEINQQRAGT